MLNSRLKFIDIKYIISGPAIGSALFQIGGFLLPFLLVGSWCLIVAILQLFVLPDINVDDSKNAQIKRNLTFFDLAKVCFELVMTWRIIIFD